MAQRYDSLSQISFLLFVERPARILWKNIWILLKYFQKILKNTNILSITSPIMVTWEAQQYHLQRRKVKALKPDIFRGRLDVRLGEVSILDRSTSLRGLLKHRHQNIRAKYLIVNDRKAFHKYKNVLPDQSKDHRVSCRHYKSNSLSVNLENKR